MIAFVSRLKLKFSKADPDVFNTTESLQQEHCLILRFDNKELLKKEEKQCKKEKDKLQIEIMTTIYYSLKFIPVVIEILTSSDHENTY